jgi:hypothetical protein
MSTQIQADHFTKALYALLDETFDNVHGVLYTHAMPSIKVSA